MAAAFAMAAMNRGGLFRVRFESRVNLGPGYEAVGDGE